MIVKIPNMRLNNSELISHPQEILALFHDFFSKLYSTSKPNLEKVQAFLRSVKLPILNGEHTDVTEEHNGQRVRLQQII